MTPEESLKILEERKRELDRIQTKVYQVGDKYFINNDTCSECGEFRFRMEARHCGNGYLSWRCRPCWDKQNE